MPGDRNCASPPPVRKWEAQKGQISWPPGLSWSALELDLELRHDSLMLTTALYRQLKELLMKVPYSACRCLKTCSGPWENEAGFCSLGNRLATQLCHEQQGSSADLWATFLGAWALSFQPVCQHPDGVFGEQPWVSGLQPGLTGLQPWFLELRQLHRHLRPSTVRQTRR